MRWSEDWVSPARAWASLAAFSLLFFIELAGSFSSLGMGGYIEAARAARARHPGAAAAAPASATL